MPEQTANPPHGSFSGKSRFLPAVLRGFMKRRTTIIDPHGPQLAKWVSEFLKFAAAHELPLAHAAVLVFDLSRSGRIAPINPLACTNDTASAKKSPLFNAICDEHSRGSCPDRM